MIDSNERATFLQSGYGIRDLFKRRTDSHNGILSKILCELKFNVVSGRSFAISSRGSVLHFPKYEGHFPVLYSADPSDLANPPCFGRKGNYLFIFFLL